MNYDHIDKVMKAFQRCNGWSLHSKLFLMNDDSLNKDLSWGDSWALGEQLIAMKWGLV